MQAAICRIIKMHTVELLKIIDLCAIIFIRREKLKQYKHTKRDIYNDLYEV